MNEKVRAATRRLTVAAVFMALTVVMSSFSLPVPGGHLYLNDVVICTASLLLDPVSAFLVGGVGSFLGDFFFYPTPMLVSLVTHGLQAVIISVCAYRGKKQYKLFWNWTGVLIGAIIMVVGYSLGRAFIYATPEAAWLKLPYQILQAAVGAVSGIYLSSFLQNRKFTRRIF